MAIFRKLVELFTHTNAGFLMHTAVRLRYSDMHDHLTLDLIREGCRIDLHEIGDLDQVSFSNGIDAAIVQKILKYCVMYNENVCSVATDRQAEVFAEAYIQNHNWDDAQQYVIDSGLEYDGDFRFGTSRKYEVPQEVLEFLFNLPGAGSTYNHLRPPEPPDPEGFLAILTSV